MKLFKNLEEINLNKYIICTYYLQSSSSLRDAAWALAIGQSVGNPNVRNRWETDKLFEDHSCLIIGNEADLSSLQEGKIKIAFPVVNTDFKTDGISHLL